MVRSSSVLVVDDDPQVRQVFKDILEGEYDVLTAESGEIALEQLDDSIDVVLLDRRMPGLAGDEVLSRIRDENYDVAVALVTAIEPDFDILDMGFDDYIVKPVSNQELRNTVRTLSLRKEYDDIINEYFELVSKVTALQQAKSPSELAENDIYVENRERLDEIKQEARSAVDIAIDSGKFTELFKDLTDTAPRTPLGSSE
jgi:DNA-binding response OmpR family regulator